MPKLESPPDRLTLVTESLEGKGLSDILDLYKSTIKEALHTINTMQTQGKLMKLKKDFEAHHKAQGKTLFHQEKKGESLNEDQINQLAVFLVREDLTKLRKALAKAVLEAGKDKSPLERAAERQKALKEISDTLRGDEFSDILFMAELVKEDMKGSVDELIKELKDPAYAEGLKKGAKYIADFKEGDPILELLKVTPFPQMTFLMTVISEILDKKQNIRDQLRKGTLKYPDFVNALRPEYQKLVKQHELPLTDFFPEDAADPKKSEKWFFNLCLISGVKERFESYDLVKMKMREVLNDRPHLKAASHQVDQLVATYYDPFGAGPLGSFGAGGIEFMSQSFPRGYPLYAGNILDGISRGLKPIENVLSSLVPVGETPDRWTANSMIMGSLQVAGAVTLLMNVAPYLIGRFMDLKRVGDDLLGFRFPDAVKHMGRFVYNTVAEGVKLPFSGRGLTAFLGFMAARGFADVEKIKKWMKQGWELISKKLPDPGTPEGIAMDFFPWCREHQDQFVEIGKANSIVLSYLWQGKKHMEKWEDKDWEKWEKEIRALPLSEAFLENLKFDEIKAYFVSFHGLMKASQAELKEEKILNLKVQVKEVKQKEVKQEEYEKLVMDRFGRDLTPARRPTITFDDLIRIGVLSEDLFKDPVHDLKRGKPLQLNFALEQQFKKTAQWVSGIR